MARTHQVDPSSAITALGHPAAADVGTVAAQGPLPAGWYATGQNACPNCGAGVHTVATGLSLTEVTETLVAGQANGAANKKLVGRWVWRCCYAVCVSCPKWHVKPRSDVKCSDCGGCSKGCQCKTCPGCSAKATEVCALCSQCADCCSGHKVAGGYSRPGWERRGVPVAVAYSEPDHTVWSTVEPVSAMADFYLLSYMEVNPDGYFDKASHSAMMMYAETASSLRAELVSKLDPIFRAYVDMAVGGELRHHKGVGGSVLNQVRRTAWGQWPSIRAQVGPDALVDAAELFREMSGSYGNERWAVIAETLHARETGKLPPWLFVDRVFSLQHNTGSVLNKVIWAAHSRYKLNGPQMCQQVGNAHAADETDLQTLAVLATPEVVALFKQWWVARNRVLIGNGERAQVMPKLRPTSSTFAKHPHRLKWSGHVVFGGKNGTSTTVAMHPEYARQLWKAKAKVAA